MLKSWDGVGGWPTMRQPMTMGLDLGLSIQCHCTGWGHPIQSNVTYTLTQPIIVKDKMLQFLIVNCQFSVTALAGGIPSNPIQSNVTYTLTQPFIVKDKMLQFLIKCEK